MLISCAWLETLLGGHDHAPLDAMVVAQTLTSLGLEVESVRSAGQGLDPVLVGEVRSVRAHPVADGLRVATVFDGRDTVDVVCGAKNLPNAGGKVAWAPPGVVLPGGIEIGTREIRTVQSHGMICSEVELDVGRDDSGILVLPENWPAGRRLVDLVPGIVDTVLELSVTPNRADALGHVGVARDLAVRLRRPLVLPHANEPEAEHSPNLVQVVARERCGRYLGYAIADVVVRPSPLWLVTRLHRLGLRSIDNVVDVTNFVLLEWGQPLHAFDRDRLAEGRVIVRCAEPSEPIETLDGRKLALTVDDLVIADGRTSQALAGIMGGSGSAVDASTRTLLLEVAWFQPAGIRRSTRRHGIHSDSSHRFERGVDPERGPELAARRAVVLIQQLTGGRCIAKHEARGELPVRKPISVRPARAKLVLGVDIPTEECERILRGLEIEVDRSDGERWNCLAPGHRPDVNREDDVIEELARQYGLDRIPATPTIPSVVRAAEPRTDARLRDSLVDALQRVGLSEVVCMAFSEQAKLRSFAREVGPDRWVRLENPMRMQASVLRTSLLPGLLDVLALNRARHGKPVRVFEVGRVYAWSDHERTLSGPTASVDAHLPDERVRAGLLLSSSPRAAGPPIGARDLTTTTRTVLASLGYELEILPADPLIDWLHGGVQARLVVHGDDGTREVGCLGEVHPDVLQTYDLHDGPRVYYAELHVERLPALPVMRYRELPRFPATSRDVSLEIPFELPASVVIDAVREAAAFVVQTARDQSDTSLQLDRGDTGDAPVEVLEDYRGPGLPDRHRALLLRLHYRSPTRSISDAEVQRFHEAVMARTCEALGPAAPRIRTR